MFLVDKDFRQALADTLKVDVADLGSYWDRQCQQAHNSAYLDIRGALLARGFLSAQIDTWDRGAEFERDIGLYWALVRGAGVHQFDPTFVDRLDRRAELMTVMVEMVGGDPEPPAGDPGRISFGMLNTTDPVTGADDKWTRDTPV
jgi:hypothetical protein